MAATSRETFTDLECIALLVFLAFPCPLIIGFGWFCLAPSPWGAIGSVCTVVCVVPAGIALALRGASTSFRTFLRDFFGLPSGSHLAG